MKVAELKDEQLDYWVAQAEGHRVRIVDDVVVVYTGGDDTGLKERRGPRYSPSSEWSDGGPIIEREKISVVFDNGEWVAGTGASLGPGGDLDWEYGDIGETALVAAMLTYVKAKFGDEVPDALDGETGGAGAMIS